MQPKDIKFSSYRLAANNLPIEQDEVERMIKAMPLNYSDKNSNTYHLMEIKDEMGYLLIYIKYGQSLPLSETIYNIESQTEEPNARKETQIEPSYQLFVLYAKNANLLYVSNSRKSSLISRWLKLNDNREISLQPIFSDIDTFAEKLKSVKKLKFIGVPDLFQHENRGVCDVIKPLCDEAGISMPKRYGIELDCREEGNLSRLVSFLKSYRARSKYSNVRLTCHGLNEDSEEMVLNTDAFHDKVCITSTPDSKKFHEPWLLLRNLIRKLE